MPPSGLAPQEIRFTRLERSQCPRPSPPRRGSRLRVSSTKDEALLARFLAAGVPPPIRMHEKAAGGSWRLDSLAKRKPLRQRSVYRCAGGRLLRDAQAKLAPPPPAAAFSTHGSLGATMTRRHGPLRRHGGSLQVRSNAIRGRQACAERAAFATSRTMPCAACGRTRATELTSSVVFSPLCPATIETRGKGSRCRNRT